MHTGIKSFISYIALLFLVIGIYTYQSWQNNIKIRIVGSTTVYPFITTISEFVTQKYHNQPSPVIEPTGSGIGAKMFCGPDSQFSPHILMTSRPLKDSEIAQCQQNSIRWKKYTLGQELFVLVANKNNPLRYLSTTDLFLASAQFVPDNKSLVYNNHKTWRSIQPRLPDVPIVIRGPHHTSGTYEAFIDGVMRSGAMSIPYMQNLLVINPSKFNEVINTVRQDGPFISSTNTGNIVINKVLQERYTIGIVGFGFYQENSHLLKVLPINNYLPNQYDPQGEGYPLMKNLYLYVKEAWHREIDRGTRRIILSLQDTALQNILKKQGLILHHEQYE